MAEEVGVAFVSLVPSARGFSKLAQRELNAELRGNKTPTINVRPTVDAATARAELTAQLTGLSRQATVQVAVDINEQATRRNLTRSLVDVSDTVRRTESVTVDADVDQAELLRDTRRAVAFAEAGAGKIDVETDVDTDRGRILGRLFGGAFGGGIDSAKGTITAALTAPFRDPKLALILVAALVTPLGAALVPAIGAAISAALIGGAGLGVIGLGAFLLRDDPEVRKAAGQLGATAKEAFTSSAGVLVQPFVAALNVLRDLVIELRPQLTEMFYAIARAILPLTRGFAGFIREAMPGILALVKAATPFLMDLEQTLPRLGEHLSRFFGVISEGGPGATQFFRDFLHLLGLGLVVFGGLIRVLTGWYGHTRMIVSRAAAVWLFFQQLTGRVISAVIGFFRRAQDFVTGVFRRIRGDVGGTIRAIPGIVLAGVSSFGRLLYDSGGRLIQGLIDGIKSKLGPLGGVMGTVAQKVRDYWPFSPAKTGPLAGRGGLFYAGQNLVTDLAGGMERKLPAVESASTQLASALGTGVRSSDGAALAPTGITAGWRPGATGDKILDGLRDLIEFRFGGDPDAALASR